MPLSTRHVSEDWALNELLAGFLSAFHMLPPRTTEDFNARFRAAALAERANPRLIEHANHFFGSIAKGRGE